MPSSVHPGECMTFDEFTRLCGVAHPQPNGAHTARRWRLTRVLVVCSLSMTCLERANALERSFETILDDRVNALREDLKDDFQRNKLSMQMNLIVQLERLRVGTMPFGDKRATRVSLRV
jgi:hypothetical protein